MADISFGPDGRVTFPTKYHGEVSLSQTKWNKICAQSERFYYRLNGEKVATTLITPDSVRHHGKIASQFFYYKKFEQFKIIEGVDATMSKLMAVVIDTATQRVATVYPTDKPKSGSKEYKPKGS